MLFQEPWHARTLLPVVLSVLYVVCLVVLGLLFRSVSTFQMLRRELVELSGMPAPFYSEKCVLGELSRRAVFSAVYGQLENALTDAGDHHVSGVILEKAGWNNIQQAYEIGLLGTAAEWYEGSDPCLQQALHESLAFMGQIAGDTDSRGNSEIRQRVRFSLAGATGEC